MNTVILLPEHEIHLWRITLTDFAEQEKKFFTLLHADEQARAKRFHFDLHRQRFIITRAMLRRILHNYLSIAPNDIVFSYGPQGKPFIVNNALNLTFNLSHSDEMAVIAITKNYDIGVDIEKIKEADHEGVVKRFFSHQEYLQFMDCAAHERILKFYRIWSRKEALIKAVGAGLFVPLDNFSVSLSEPSEWITLMDKQWYVESVDVHAEYETAFATNQKIQRIQLRTCTLDDVLE